jgi:hypothetical protein
MSLDVEPCPEGERMSVQQWATLASAAAATIAAILAGVNLRLTGRREHLGWVRSALEATFVDFLTASYDHLAASRETVKLRRGGESRRTEGEWRRAAEEANDVMMKAVTRIRVLASDRMAELALGLRDRTELEVALFKEQKYDEFVGGRPERIAAFHADRDVFIDEAQRLLGIREASEARLRLRRK